MVKQRTLTDEEWMMKTEKTADGIVFRQEERYLHLQVINESIIRVVESATGKAPTRASLTTLEQAPFSAFEFQERPNCSVLQTERVQVEVSSDLRLSFKSADGSAILTEPSDARSIKPSVTDREGEYEITQRFTLSEQEGLYGLGQHQTGLVNCRGQRLTLVQANMTIVVPFLISTAGWGLLWENCSHTEFADDKDGIQLWSEVGDGIDYYFIYGPQLDDIIAGYRQLTGTTPMYGKWAYGYWQCKERYVDQDDLLSVIKEYRDREIPIDNIVQDWKYWGELGWSPMTFDPTVFPDPEEMCRMIHDDYNAHLMISIWPALGLKTEIHDVFERAGKLLPCDHWATAHVYDAFDDEAREIYWDYVNRGIFAKGVDAWWMDGTEPEFCFADSPLDSKEKIVANSDNALGSWSRYLNAFSLMTTKGVYEGQRETTSDKRVFILSRSSFAGQQRYGAAAWSGDVSSTWEIFQRQIPAGINFCMSGTPYWTTDIGGFFTKGQGAYYPGGCEEDAYRELYVRWFQYGTFCPLFRSHGTHTPREVWRFGEPGSWAYDTLMRFDNLRYRLMPYIYSLAWQVTNSGYTMMRGLPMDFQQDRACYDVDDQFMFGPALMANPVTQCMYHPRESLTRPIDHEFLRDATGQEKGISATYYNGMEFDELARDKQDWNIDFDWGGAPPAGVGEENYSIRWTGSIVPSEDGEHKFEVLCDHGVRLWIDGELIIDAWEKRDATSRTASVDFQAGQAKSLKLEYCHGSGNTGGIILSWLTPSSRQALAGERNATTTRTVYLPEGNGWYDFWTGTRLSGKQTIEVDCPIETMPLYVKAGSILPMGPYLQYASEKPADPIELRIYPGADVSFTIYEDEDDGYNYESGTYATIPITWDDANRELTIGGREGGFPGMLEERTFQVVLVRRDHGTGVEPCSRPDAELKYRGKIVSRVL